MRLVTSTRQSSVGLAFAADAAGLTLLVFKPILTGLILTVKIRLEFKRELMKPKGVVFSLAASAVLLVVASPSQAQDWTSASVPNGFWASVASSADGAKLVAASPNLGLIETSTDSGTTWSPCGAPSNAWYSVACSADGTKLAAVTFHGSIYTSPDSGGSWTDVLDVPINPVSFPDWYFLPSIACSADGTKLAAMICPNGTGQWIITSTNFGATWVTNGSGAFHARTNGFCTSSPCWGSVLSSVASSADGTKLAVAFVAGDVCTSLDGGLNWTSNNLPAFNWNGIASSADGNKLALVTGLVGQLTPIYVSTNGGSTWQMSGAPANLNTSWRAVASSADGSRLVAVCGWGVNAYQRGRIYTSADSGLTWVSNNSPSTYWSSVASLADGRKLVATVGIDYSGTLGGGIWISQSAPAPCLNITPQGDGFALSWIVPSANFVLQQNSDMTTSNWTDVAIPPTLNLTNLQYQLTMSLTGSQQYYRLVAR